MRGAGGAGLTEELRQMLGDGGIARVVQSDFHQRGAPGTLGSGGGLHDREKTVEQDLANFVARDLAAQRPAYQTGAAAQNGDRMASGRAAREQGFLGGARLPPEGMKLQGVERCKLPLGEAGH